MVGGGGATTVGVNLLPPLGLKDFSVGDTGGLLDEGLSVDGASLPLLPQPAASELTARSAAAQDVTTLRRPTRISFMAFFLDNQRRDASLRKFWRTGRGFANTSSMSRRCRFGNHFG
jgi:hypothetical protein